MPLCHNRGSGAGSGAHAGNRGGPGVDYLCMGETSTTRRAVTAVAVAALLGLAPAGCGGGDGDDGDGGAASPGPPASPMPDPTPSEPAPSPTAGSVELFEFEIAGGVATPPLDRATVEQGSQVRIMVTSDQPDELHLHGYDLDAQTAPGEPGVIEFVADRAGLFELETHDSGLVLLQLVVE